MKRSERLLSNAIQEFGWAAVILMVSITIGCWSARVWLSSAPGGALMLILTLVGLSLAFDKGREALRLIRLSDIESHWEHEEEIRPRL